MSNKPTYKTSRKYKCPYCDFRAIRGDLVSHVEKKHQELIPEGYTAARAVYDFINGKNYGTCMICKAKVYEWNDKINRYNNLCTNPKCREEVRRIALERHMRVYNKPTLLNDPEQQEKMLANRKISGSYTFTDGGKVTYTGQYEKKALEFMDKVLNIPSTDIQAPGPVLEYEYNGETHKWITDIYYIPANLLIEIKDGGSNPNNRTMTSYREKQVAKETMITNMGTFNYIRLTNNDFLQLLDIFADMKNAALSDPNPKATIHINEEVGGLPPQRPPEAYIIPYGMNNVFSGFAYSDSEMDKVITSDDEDNILPMTEETFNNRYTTGPRMYYIGEDAEEKIQAIRKYITETKKLSPLTFAEQLIGRKLYKWQEVVLESCFKYYDKEDNAKLNKLLENGTYRMIRSNFNDNFKDTNVVETIGNVFICQSPDNGYYAVTPESFYMASEYFSDIESLKDSGVVELMNNLFKQRFINNGGQEDAKHS